MKQSIIHIDSIKLLNYNYIITVLRNYISLLKAKIGLDLHLTPEKNFKIVRDIPPYKCKNYNNSEGYRVQVGTNTFVIFL